MERIPEPELMDSEAQVRAYAEADFEAPHGACVEDFCHRFPNEPAAGRILDLGCGPADITCRLARVRNGTTLTAVDAGPNMLAAADQRVRDEGLAHRIELVEGRLPGAELPAASFDAVVSNSLLHHMAEPDALWKTIARTARPGAPVYVMDLMRPNSRAAARALVEEHAANEPEVLQEDFFNSLLAAWRPGEIRQQLAETGLDHLSVEALSDRHLLVWGRR